MNPLKKIKNWYARHERHISVIGLFGGFIFDAIALERIDLFLENFWILIHLALAGLGIFFLNLYEQGRGKERDTTRKPEDPSGAIHFWLLFMTQFMFGGLLSTYLVFYFRSATLASSWPFLLLLVIAFMCNEALKKHYTRLTFQISILFLSIYSFAIFFLPVLMHRIGPEIFILSGLATLVVLWLFLSLLRFFTPEKLEQGRPLLFLSISIIFILVNVLYFTNLIPPIPLSLKEAGVYHLITKDNEGNYILKGEVIDPQTKWLDFFRSYHVYHQIPGEPVYVFTAVFSPTALNTNIIHNWQKYDEVKKKWISQSRVSLPILGGRDGGYRTYSNQSDLSSGLWRVDVETQQGQDVGRIKFLIEKSTTNTPEKITLHTTLQAQN